MRLSLRSWIWRVPVEREVDDEIAFHVEMLTRDFTARGLPADRAREAALRRMGDLGHVRHTCIDLGKKREREMRLTQWLEDLRDDVRFALRQLRAAPAFAVVAATTLALGIGANSAIFALVDTILLRPLPFPVADRLVMVWDRTDTMMRGRSAPANLLDWSERNRSFDAMAGFVPGMGGAMAMSGTSGFAETVPRQWVTVGFFDVLGVKAVAGRTFLPSDAGPQPNAVVMSEGLWRSRFGADPSVIGRTIRFDGMPFTIVGVVPQAFQFLGPKGIWAMLPNSRTVAMRRQRMLMAIGRMKPGVSLEAASTDLGAVADGLAREFPETNTGRGVMLEPMRDVVVGRELRVTLMLFLGVVGFVLIICCANVANLLLARATVRARELAVRAALGAGRRRIVRQLLTESLVLAAAGGALGLAIGAAILRVAPSIIPQGLLPPEVHLVFDGRVVIFGAAAALFVGLLFGLAPAWQATGLAPATALVSDRRVTARGGRLRRLLVAGEVATAVLLLFGAGLLLRTLLALERVDRGYRNDRVLTMMVDPLGSQFPTEPSLLQFFRNVEDEVRKLPGIRSVAWSSDLPMSASQTGEYTLEIAGDAPVAESHRLVADSQIVSPSYFQTIDLPVVTGRGFTDRDTRETSPVCIVDEAFVRKHLGGRSPIGLTLSMRATSVASAPATVREIIGVVRQVKSRPDELEDMIQVYVPQAQNRTDDIYLLVRPESGRPDALANPVRAAIGRIDREQLVSVHSVRTLEDVAWEMTARHRFRARMVTTLAGLALLMAMIGVFGILAFTVQQRVREFGVRMALGAATRDVFGLVAKSAAGMIVVGAVSGLVLAAILSRLLESVLFDVRPLDPLTFAAVLVVTAATAAVAAAAPAWRAARIDPGVALRSE